MIKKMMSHRPPKQDRLAFAAWTSMFIPFAARFSAPCKNKNGKAAKCCSTWEDRKNESCEQRAKTHDEAVGSSANLRVHCSTSICFSLIFRRWMTLNSLYIYIILYLYSFVEGKFPTK